MSTNFGAIQKNVIRIGPQLAKLSVSTHESTLTTLKPIISCFENSVDPDELASADQNSNCFQPCLQLHVLINGILQVKFPDFIRFKIL